MLDDAEQKRQFKSEKIKRKIKCKKEEVKIKKEITFSLQLMCLLRYLLLFQMHLLQLMPPLIILESTVITSFQPILLCNYDPPNNFEGFFQLKKIPQYSK